MLLLWAGNRALYLVRYTHVSGSTGQVGVSHMLHTKTTQHALPATRGRAERNGANMTSTLGGGVWQGQAGSGFVCWPCSGRTPHGRQKDTI